MQALMHNHWRGVQRTVLSLPNLISLMTLLIVCALCYAATDRYFALTSPETYQSLCVVGWSVSQPRYSPDSTQVLFDKPGNVDFTDTESAILDSLGAIMIPESQIQAWLNENGWTSGEGGE